MTDIAISEAAYPTPEQVHATLLSSIRYGYAQQGVTVNVKKGSELWYRMLPVAGRISLAIANGQLALRDINPLTAVGQGLIDLAAVFGVTERPASYSTGPLIVTVLAPAVAVTIPQGFRWSAPNGLSYAANATVTVANGGTVAMTAVDAGADGDQAAATVGTWESAAIAFLGKQATVAPGGIDGGADADDEEQLRTRLLRRLSFPRVGGNWAQIADWAEESSAAIEFAAVYPAARGPASYDVAIVGDADDPVLGLSVQTQAHSAVVAEMPGFANLNLTSVVEQQLDVIINLAVPLPVIAGGIGGGWVDATPWPSTAETVPLTYGEIIALSYPNNWISVNSSAADPPTAGCRFAIWNPATLEFGVFTAASVTFAAFYFITIDGTLPTWVVNGMYCSAWCENLQEYGAAFLAAMQALGPGEKSSNVDLLRWCRRKPGPDVERPYQLTSQQLSAVSGGHQEVSDLSYAGRFATGTKTTTTTPAVPATPGNAPRLLTLQHLAFRRQV